MTGQRDTRMNLRIAQIADENRADDTSHGPCGQQAAMDGTDKFGAEHIREVAGTVAKPPPYIERITPKKAMNSIWSPLRAATVRASRGQSERKEARVGCLRRCDPKARPRKNRPTY